MDSRRRATPQVFATALDSPRGLAFGPDGHLYVAEGGRGGTRATGEADCEQIPPPIGPYSGGMTARISRIDPSGERFTVADGLPSSQTSPRTGGQVSGVADVAFIGETLYALIGGAGCSHGLAGTANGIYRVENGDLRLVANLSEWRASNPVAQPDPNDDEYDGTWWSMVAVDGAFYAVEPNHGEVVKVTEDGQVSRVCDISASQGHIVPTAIAYSDGAFYVGNYGPAPFTAGGAQVLRITADGEVGVAAKGLSAVLGLAFSAEGRLYAVENTTRPPQPGHSSGRLVRIGATGALGVVSGAFMQPTGLAFGPDGAAYVSTYGIGPAGAGRIERVPI